MAELLKSARRKLARAKEHVAELNASAEHFFGSNPYRLVSEPHATDALSVVYRLRFDNGIPDSIENSVADALHNLRDSLDNAGFALAVAAGNADPRNCVFPFARSAEEFKNALGRAKDIPKEFHEIFRSYGPYRGGNDVLWALGKLAVTDKHRLLVISLNSQLGDILGEGGIRSIPMNPSWDSTTRSIELFTGVVGHPVRLYIEFAFFLSFADLPFLADAPVWKVLDYLVEIVDHILGSIDAEAQRLGLST